MNRKNLAKELATRMGESPAKTEKMVAEIFSIIEEHLETGGEIQIQGFGKLYSRKSKPTRRRNPINGQLIDVPEKTGVFFKVSPKFKEKLN